MEQELKSTMTGRIVVGVDGSGPSEAAVAWAVERAALVGAEVDLVYVIDMSAFSREPVFLDEAHNAAEDVLRRAVSQVAGKYPSVVLTWHILVGFPVRELAKYAAKAELLVVGTHKGSKLQGVLAGTKGIKLAAVSPVPVCVIPEFDVSARSGVVVGVDQEKVSGVALDRAIAEALSGGDELTVVYAWSLPVSPSVQYVWSPEILDRVEADAKEFVQETVEEVAAKHPGVKISGVAVQGSPVSALVDYGKKARLVVVGNRGLKGVGRLLLGSVSHGVLNNLTAPTLIVRAVAVPEDALDEPEQ